MGSFGTVVSCWFAEREELEFEDVLPTFGVEPALMLTFAGSGSAGAVWEVFVGLDSGVGVSATGGRTGEFPNTHVASEWNSDTWDVATHMESNWDSAALQHNPPH